MAIIKYKTANGYKTLEVPTVQRAVMPSAASMPTGAVVQYTGATAGDFVNGYFYKVEEITSTVTVSYLGYSLDFGSNHTSTFYGKDGQTDGYFYACSTSILDGVSGVPNFTLLDGNTWIKDGQLYTEANAPTGAYAMRFAYAGVGEVSSAYSREMMSDRSIYESNTQRYIRRESSLDTTNQETAITKYWARVNVQPSSAGEAESYNDLTDKPAINGHTLGGDQTGEALGLVDMPDYSAGEHKVGTWVDGSAIYERAFTITGFAKMAAGSTYEIIATPRATYGIDKLISGSVMVKTVAVQDNTTPIYTINNGHFWNNEYDDVIKFVPSYALGSNAPQDIKEMYAILRYTKVQS